MSATHPPERSVPGAPQPGDVPRRRPNLRPLYGGKRRRRAARAAATLPQRFFDFFWGSGIADDIPALTYYLVLSLAPFALGLAALEALLLEDYVSALDVAQQINRFLPDAVHGDIQRLVIGTRRNSPELIAVAIFAMLWTSSGAIGVVERCLSRMLDCPRHSIVAGRLRNLGLGAGVAAMVILAAAGSSVANGISDALQFVVVAPPTWIILAANTGGSIVVFAAIYRWAPRGRLHWRSALIGGLPAGIAIQIIPTVVGVYVGATAGLAAERLFLLLAVVLFGLYTMALVIMVGAGVAARAERRRGGGC